MNALSILICVGCLGIVLYIVGTERIRDVLEDFWAEDDRERHLARCRLLAGDARDEAWELQRRELAALPTVEPRRRLG